MTIEMLALQGRNNVYNSMAASLGSKIYGIRKSNVKECMVDFQGLEHRLEFVLNVHGIEFINDSKATNINSTWYALGSMKKPVVLILGGADKGSDYLYLKDLVKVHVKAIICLGKDNSSIKEAFSDLEIPITEATSMRHAVNAAYVIAKKDDTVLLSPGCASFDMFENFEDRGRQFKQAVRDL